MRKDRKELENIRDLVNNNNVNPNEFDGCMERFEKMASASTVHKPRSERGLPPKGMQPIEAYSF